MNGRGRDSDEDDFADAFFDLDGVTLEQRVRDACYDLLFFAAGKDAATEIVCPRCSVACGDLRTASAGCIPFGVACPRLRGHVSPACKRIATPFGDSPASALFRSMVLTS